MMIIRDGKYIGVLYLTGMTFSNYDITGLRAIFDSLQNHHPERSVLCHFMVSNFMLMPYSYILIMFRFPFYGFPVMPSSPTPLCTDFSDCTDFSSMMHPCYFMAFGGSCHRLW